MKKEEDGRDIKQIQMDLRIVIGELAAMQRRLGVIEDDILGIAQCDVIDNTIGMLDDVVRDLYCIKEKENA